MAEDKSEMDRAFLRKVMALEEMDLRGMFGGRSMRLRRRPVGPRIRKESLTDMESSDSSGIGVARVAAQWVDYLIR